MKWGGGDQGMTSEVGDQGMTSEVGGGGDQGMTSEVGGPRYDE